MKTTFYIPAAVFALATLVSSSPVPEPGWGAWNDHGRDCEVDSPFHFTSTYSVIATPDQVYNGTVNKPGQPGAAGYFNFGINSDLNVICYNITLMGVTGPYQSLALTATHMHEAARAASGPPRLAFPNPVGDDRIRRSVGCLTAPFKTGILVNGTDTGDNFTVKKIEDNPAAFFCDTHTKMYVPGAVRGQLA